MTILDALNAAACILIVAAAILTVIGAFAKLVNTVQRWKW